MLLDFALCIRTRFIFGTGVTDKIGAEIAAMGVRSVLSPTTIPLESDGYRIGPRI